MAALVRTVDVFELARTGGRVEGEVAIADLPRLPASLASARGVVEVSLGGLVDAQRRPAALLEFSTSVDLTCDCCSSALPWPLHGRARYWFVRSEDELGRIPVDEADDEPLLGSARFDLHELVEDELLLALPMSPRHPVCQSAAVSAASGRVESAGDETARPRPFAALAGLKDGLKARRS
jgi:uncharacterized protein